MSNEPLYAVIERLADLMLPETISWREIKSHVTGYSKQKAVEQVVEAAKKDPLFTRIRLHIIYSELRELANNGGLL